MCSEQPSYAPEPTDDRLDTLYSPVYSQRYPSKHGALIEARQVFLEESDMAERPGPAEARLGSELWDGIEFPPDGAPGRLLALMRSGGALATYSARGVGRCSFEAVEFCTGKRSGSPGKRERLVAVR